MSDEERISREKFYKNLVWVVDGEPFAKNFDIYHMLPSPESDLAKDLKWYKAKRGLNGANSGIFHRISEGKRENPDYSNEKPGMVEIHGIREVEEELHMNYIGHHQYDWIRPRNTWLEAECPVYIDLGKDYLAHLTNYDETELKCIRLVAKKKFLHDVMTETDVNAIASRFYPI